jgi:hypothetical protein
MAALNCLIYKDLQKAGDGARTHDIQLGKLTLYQLSYTRMRMSGNIMSMHVHRDTRIATILV